MDPPAPLSAYLAILAAAPVAAVLAPAAAATTVVVATRTGADRGGHGEDRHEDDDQRDRHRGEHLAGVRAHRNAPAEPAQVTASSRNTEVPRTGSSGLAACHQRSTTTFRASTPSSAAPVTAW